MTVVRVKGRRGVTVLGTPPAFGGHPGQGVGVAAPAPSQEVRRGRHTVASLQERIARCEAAMANPRSPEHAAAQAAKLAKARAKLAALIQSTEEK